MGARNIDNIKIGDVLNNRKKETVKKIEWSRRREWVKVNDAYIYSAGGTY